MLAFAVARCVVAPLVLELLLRGFVLPALSSWRGTFTGGVIVSLLGVATTATDAALVPCVLFLQLLLCALYLLSRSLLPGVALSAGASAAALGAALAWDVLAILALTAACIALAPALLVAAMIAQR